MEIKIMVYVLIGLFIGMILHEYFHGRVADLLGDHTARNAGRLTLNPIAHIDPFGTVLLPLTLFVIGIITGSYFLFGYAKPVPVNPFNLKKPKRDMVLVAVAGPLTNIVIAFGFALIGMVFRLAGLKITELYVFLYYAAFINLFLALFNLIPIPPLDGSHILEYFLSPRNKQRYMEIAPYGFVIIIGLIFITSRVGLLGAILSPFEHLLQLIILGV